MKTAEELKQDIHFSTTRGGESLHFRTTWGLFSPRDFDEGSSLLLHNLDVGQTDAVLDLGCGYGALGLTLAKRIPEGRITLVDKDFVAVEYTEKNVEGNSLSNCEVLLSNGFSHVPQDALFDTIVSNLPAKVGRELLYIFLTDAKAHLTPGGQIVVVTVNGLRKFIKRNFLDVFGDYKKLKQGTNYTVARAFKAS
jgi:16S rRNA (guanine1207-N2)-methyltransferase